MTEPASIRYKNPGAMWGKGNPIATKWGAGPTVNLNDGLGQGNNIAVFPTYVQGICAQIDLWRSPRYHNKTFSEAIKVWSGGNWVQSYIDFVKKHAPGMTENTVMSDGLLNSSLGISFLKAQAWHEAGKQYPAPDADWIEAQRRVFGGSASATPKEDTQVIPVPEHDTKWLQTSLNTLGANPKLVIDGIVGPPLRSAISDFQQKNGLDADGLVGPATMRELILDLAAEGMPPEIKLPAPGTPAHAGLAPTFWGRVVALFHPKVG